MGALGLTEKQSVDLARQYLDSRHTDRRAELRKELASFEGDLDAVLAGLRPSPRRGMEKGLSSLQHFSDPQLRAIYPEDHLYYFVPESYNPAEQMGLLILLHGGGSGTKREAAGRLLEQDPERGHALTEYLADLPFITVSPSAPWSETSSKRWSLPEADDYIAGVITESMSRFAIDPDRIVLAGSSMGGMGAYDLGLRMSDRFAAVGPFSGSWQRAYWPVVLGTPFYIIHGVEDAVPPSDPVRDHRPKYTDVFYAQEADRLLNRYGLAHVYAQHNKGHSSWDALPELASFCSWVTHQRRDPLQGRVVVATPADGVCPSVHNRWLSILEVGDGEIVLDATRVVGTWGWTETLQHWQDCRIERDSVGMKGAAADAVYLGDNAFEVVTENVRRLEIWLHPAMVDLSREIGITVDGNAMTASANASLGDALDSYLRRRDWGMIYPAKLVVDA